MNYLKQLFIMVNRYVIEIVNYQINVYNIETLLKKPLRTYKKRIVTTVTYNYNYVTNRHW